MCPYNSKMTNFYEGNSYKNPPHWLLNSKCSYSLGMRIDHKVGKPLNTNTDKAAHLPKLGVRISREEVWHARLNILLKVWLVAHASGRGSVGA